MDREREQLRALTGTRFLAACSVVLYHTIVIFRVQLPLTTWISSLASQGYLGVDFFFLLSGFILSYSYTGSDGSIHGSTVSFWVARFARIYPVYVLGLVLDAVPYFLTSTTMHARIVTEIANPLLLQAWTPIIVPAAIQMWNPPGWSLSNEAFFYLLFPLLLPLMSKHASRVLVRITILAWAASGLLPSILVLFATHGLQYQLTSEWRYVLDYSPLLHLPEFVLGMASGIFFTHTQRVSWRPTVLVANLGLVTLCSCLIFLLLSLDNYSRAPFVTPLLMGIIFILAFSRRGIATILGSKPFVHLGEISYGIYILHWPVFSWIVFLNIWHILSGWTLATVYFTAVLVISTFTYYVLERPARRWIRLVWSRRQQRAKDLQLLTSKTSVGERRIN